ncbi:MAG: PadR family transcriptional regulator [Clostridiaceae bacterium]|nr:PadR family transcriptional regulator [Clostridiaceae bacterium]
MDVQMKRGLLEVCVLASLLKEDSYGYRIIRDVSPYVEISESTLYPILRRLEAANLLSVREEPYNGRLRKYYRITETGRRRVSVFLEEWRSVMTVYEYIREAQYDDKK